MALIKLNPKSSLNKAFLKVKPNRVEIEKFKSHLISLLDNINETESEEFHKNLISEFLKKTYYDPSYYINTKGRNDLVIHNGKEAKDSVAVIIEAKKPTNKAEMLKQENINTKAFQELVLYFLRERITHKNHEIKCLVATNINEWFIFDATVFEKNFAQNKALVAKFNDFVDGRLSGDTTDFFYKEIAQPAIAAITTDIEFTYFDIRDYDKPLRNENKQDDNKLISLFKLLSPEHLLKLPFINDSNSLDKRFYSELLHIIGLIETKEGTKKLIQRKDIAERNTGSLLENAIEQIEARDKLAVFDNPAKFGANKEERLFNVGLELVITWINRILFLKLLEAQLLSYHKGNNSYAFLNHQKISNFDDLDSLFFQVLAKKGSERKSEAQILFSKVPYLNSSLFEPTDIEHKFIFISNLRDEKKMPVLISTVLKDGNGKKFIGELTTLEYLFKFLDSYDFASEGAEEIQEENKSLINASVLGLIFEKINGYKDGSFFTPGLITMYMSRETIRNAVVQKFNSTKNWQCKSIDDLYENIEDRKEANEIINSLKICDPAVGSGHFLVSALNELIAVKSDLKILTGRDGKRLKEYRVEVVNDELIVTDEDGEFFEYKPLHPESQRIQEALFHEKQTIIENCLFGVDINPNSVKICRLRLWIELLKNAYYKTNDELETLPNIDINIKCGNSLISRFPLDSDLKEALKKSKISISSYKSAVDTYRNASSKEQKREMEKLIDEIKNNFRIEISGNDPKIRRLVKLQNELGYLLNQSSLFDETNQEKKVRKLKLKKLEDEATNLNQEIEQIKSNKVYENAFEWRFEFPEALNDLGDFIGFDVLIGNPPYMITYDELQKKFLENNFIEFKRNNDLYVAFIVQAFNLLKLNGNYSFITPNTFIKGSYFKTIREFLAQKAQILEIIDFGNILVFEGVSVFCAITSAKKQAPTFDWIMKSDLEKVRGEIKFLETDFLVKNDLIKKLDKYPKFENYFHIKDVGFNYWTEGKGKVRGGSIGSRVLYKGTKKSSKDISYIKGSDITKYDLSFSDNYLMHDWQSMLSEKDTFRFSKDFFDKTPKVVYRQTSNKIIATIDVEKNCCDKTVHILVNNETSNYDLRYVLGLLNSKLLNYYFNSYKDEEGRAFAQVKTVDIKNLPFIETENSDVINLVEKILVSKKQNPNIDVALYEAQIDKIIYSTYNLSIEEVELIEKTDSF